MADQLAASVLTALDKLSGGEHAGFRPVHARGVMASGTFVPSVRAAALTRAPHAQRPSTPVTVRFSIASGLPAAPGNDPATASPQGMAVRFHLGEHVHTDIVAHSHDGFPAATGEEFLALLEAVAASGPGAASPPPIAEFLGSHPAAARYVRAPKPVPAGFDRQAYFAVTAFKLVSPQGVERFGRFRLRPVSGVSLLAPEEAAARASEFLNPALEETLAAGPVRFAVLVQLAEPGDVVDDATVSWPADREEAEFGVLTLTELVDPMAPELRKIIFDPLPRVDGIESAGDPLTDIRSEVYLVSGRRRRAAVAAGLAE
jgi:catalase